MSLDMSHPFLITSPGRTATKWLAWVMNHSEKWTVEHEPIVLSYDPYHGAVSPRHLLQIVVDRPMPIHHNLGVIVRDPIAQGISIQNRARVTGAPCERLFIKHAKRYYEILEEMISKHGAMPISYSEMTTDKDYLQYVLNGFMIEDVDVTDEMLATKKNTIEGPFTVLAGDLRKAVHKYAMPFWVKYRHA